MKKNVSYLVWVLGVTFIIYRLLGNVDSCLNKFSNKDDFTKYSKACSTKAGFKRNAFPSLADILSPKFADQVQCVAKCILGSLELIDELGRLDRDLLVDLIEDKAPPAMFLKLTEIANACADSSGTDGVNGTRLGVSLKECEPMRKFYGCLVKTSKKVSKGASISQHKYLKISYD